MNEAAVPDDVAPVRWSLLAGNFVVGCGVMVAIGTLNDLSRSLQVSVSIAGQLVAVGAAVICFGAPLLAGWASGFDRRRLLAGSLLWYAAGHLLCAAMPSFAALLPVRALSVLAAAVFTPQAAAVVGALAPPAQRGRAITFIFLGWSVASVVGMPIGALLGDAFGWRAAFVAVAAISLVAAGWVWATVPEGIRPPAMSLADWRHVFADPLLMAMVLVTALSGAGQFTLFSYFGPYFEAVLGEGTATVTLAFAWFGVFGVVGNVVASRLVDRVGAGRAVNGALVLMAVSLAAWPLGSGPASLALILVPWALGCFSSNSMQQARLGAAAPALAPALMALNTSAIYLGQATGAASGGWLIAHSGHGWLSSVGVVWLVAAIALSVWAGRADRVERSRARHARPATVEI